MFAPRYLSLVIVVVCVAMALIGKIALHPTGRMDTQGKRLKPF